MFVLQKYASLEFILFNLVQYHNVVFCDNIYIYSKQCKTLQLHNKASVTIMADFSPEFDPPVRWRSKHQTKNDC